MSTLYVFKDGEYVAKDWVKGNGKEYAKAGYIVQPGVRRPIGSRL